MTCQPSVWLPYYHQGCTGKTYTLQRPLLILRHPSSVSRGKLDEVLVARLLIEPIGIQLDLVTLILLNKTSGNGWNQQRGDG